MMAVRTRLLLVWMFCVSSPASACFRKSSGHGSGNAISISTGRPQVSRPRNPPPDPTPHSRGTPKISLRGSEFVDPEGRSRTFHGFNAVVKNPPWYPVYLLNDTRLALYKSWGFNVVRLGTMWAGVEPTPGHYNETYIAVLRDIVAKLQQHGIYVILDAHQDVLSARFGTYDGVPDWLMDMFRPPAHPFPWPLPSGRPLAWTDGYLTQAAGMAFQDLYDNYNGTRDAFSRFWRKIASAFGQFDNVLGYEVMNEPWAGDIYSRPSLLAPGIAGRYNLLPFYDHVNEAIRSVDSATLLFYETVTWGIYLNGERLGSGFNRVPGGPTYVNMSVLSFHYYCFLLQYNREHQPYSWARRVLCDDFLGPRVFDAVADDVTVIGGASFLTEFGACDPDGHPDTPATVECESVMAAADDYLKSWTYWDSLFFDPDGTVNLTLTEPFVRPYVQATAGTLLAMNFDTDTKIFTFRYASLEDRGAGSTDVYIPKLKYESGIVVVASDGISWTFDNTTQILSLYCAENGSTCPREVNVAIRPT